MIITEQISDDLVRRYSSDGMRLLKAGTDELYDEAVDLITAPYTYVESNSPIDEEPAGDDPEMVVQNEPAAEEESP